MSLSAQSFEELRKHWAVGNFGSKALKKADRLVNERLAVRAVEPISFSFVDKPDSEAFLEKVALAYEMAAIEGLDELSRASGAGDSLRNQTISASYKAFDIRQLMSVPKDTDGRLFNVLHLSALAYCGDRWSDLRRWYKSNSEAIEAPSIVNVPWDQRLLYRLFDCWVRLFRKQGWDDLHRISETIAGLRNDQKEHEAVRLKNETLPENRAIAFRLVSLYHWAKSTEIVAQYMIQGEPANPFGVLDRHFEAAIKSAVASDDAPLEIVIRWLHASAGIMVSNSLWWATRSINSKTSDFVRSLTHRKHRAMFELLPPQRAALLETGLLNPAKTAIVVDMPTSGGKTLLAQFRILQALNQFSADGGWVAYVAPTRALVAQLARRLRNDFEPIDLRVEQLTAAVEVDTFEEEILSGERTPFNILIATPEKLSLIIRNKKVERPLALVVMDEAHNLETEGRGLRIELLLATVMRDCPTASFLLLMPYVEDSKSVAQWLARDVDAGETISFGTTPWKPNERIIGLYSAVADNSKRGGWRLSFETLTTTPKAMQLKGKHRVGGVKPLNVPKSTVLNKDKQVGLGVQTAAMAKMMSARGTSVAIANTIPSVWSMARKIADSLHALEKHQDEIELVQNLIRSEISPDFELIQLLGKGVGVHHAGLSDEIRGLIEWLAESGKLKVLCATTTIAQGLNFPVSSVFLQTRQYPYGKEMSPREFWNLAGRAGRIDHDSVGVVGLAEGKDRQALIDFISRNTGALVSRLVTLLDELAAEGKSENLSDFLWKDEWEDFRCYIAHSLAEKKKLDAVLADTDHLLRQTYGYTTLRNDPDQREKADALLEETQNYVRKLAEYPGRAELADSTGFSPEGIGKAITEMSNLEEKLTTSDWSPESLFGDGRKMADLFGVMLNIPQLKRQLDDIGGQGFDHSHLSNITRDWVNGKGIEAIAREYFLRDRSDENATIAISNACRTIYREIANSGTWGVSALSRVSGSGIDFESLSDNERRRINALPAMIYHGVRTEDAVLMRMNSVPRSAAENLGKLYREEKENDDERFSVGQARTFLKELGSDEWESIRPKTAALSGDGYKRVWQVLSGEEG